eukprot:5989229-Amphidinium_carterae.1
MKSIGSGNILLGCSGSLRSGNGLSQLRHITTFSSYLRDINYKKLKKRSKTLRHPPPPTEMM